MKKIMKKWHMSGSSTSMFIQECLRVHNKYRAIHGSPGLFLSQELTRYAQEWADILTKRSIFEHRPNCEYGENLFTAFENDPNWIVRPSDPVKSWLQPRNLRQIMAKAKAPVTASQKTKDKKEQGKNGVGVKEKQLVLTPSEKELGIRITQPKQETIDTMMRLYAVPSEKIRVWTCWLTKVGERADDWQWWIRAQIGLALRISDHLQRAVIPLEVEEGTILAQRDGRASDATIVPEESETKEATTEVSDVDATQTEPTLPEQEMPVEKDEVPVELSNTAVPEVEPGEMEQPAEVSEENRSEEKGDKNEGMPKEVKKTKAGKPEPKIVYNEGFWPIGVRWKPMSQRGKRKPPPQREPDKIPIPASEEEMNELIIKIKHQGVIYRSLYKHWLQTADQAIKQIMGRTVLPTKEVYFNGEEVPYFFYLESEPDNDYAIEHDDEEILLPDPGREKITHQFTHLYFNLSDKPGKGGKPWV